MSWASEELQATDLGDRRRTERLVTIVEDLIAQPHASVPQSNSKFKIENAKLKMVIQGCSR